MPISRVFVTATISDGSNEENLPRGLTTNYPLIAARDMKRLFARLRRSQGSLYSRPKRSFPASMACSHLTELGPMEARHRALGEKAEN